jgi:hypothetical protein
VAAQVSFLHATRVSLDLKQARVLALIHFDIRYCPRTLTTMAIEMQLAGHQLSDNFLGSCCGELTTNHTVKLLFYIKITATFWYLGSIARGLAHLHAAGVVHLVCHVSV